MVRLASLVFLVGVMGCSPGGYAPAPYELDIANAPPPAEELPDEVEEGVNPWVDTANQSVSTFSADVDTASYSLTRRSLQEGTPVDADSVRVEEFLNYFRYDRMESEPGLPFGVELEVGPSTFGPSANIEMLRIGVQAAPISAADRAPVNLVFLVDVSGSMNTPDKLGLLKYSLGQLVDRLEPTDTLGIVVYAGASGVALPVTAVSDKSAILDALDGLQAGGSTNGEAGIREAYDLAESAFRADGVNRVVLCSDGDMNVGVRDEALVELVESFRDRDIFLTTLGFGQGNFDDQQMEQLADNGNGNYAYIDSKNEALRVLGENLVGTLQVVAKDVKLQVTFDPSVVERWRLIGYENRLLQEDDFDDDSVDAGDMGAGHHVTALYEIERVASATGSVADLEIRFKEPTAEESTAHSFSVEEVQTLQSVSDDFRFAMGVAEFAEILRDSPHSTGERFQEVSELIEAGRPLNRRTPMQTQLLDLIELARPE